MSINRLQVNINSDNEHLFLEVESSDDINICVEFLERLFKKKKSKPIMELKEVQVGMIGPRKPT